MVYRGTLSTDVYEVNCRFPEMGGVGSSRVMDVNSMGAFVSTIGP